MLEVKCVLILNPNLDCTRGIDFISQLKQYVEKYVKNNKT